MEKIKKIKWHKALQLSNLGSGTIVTDVPIKDAMFRLPIERGLEMSLSDGFNTWKRVVAIMRYDQILPVYYCLDCNQIEDGRHRIMATKIYGKKKISIMLWDRCYKKNRETMQELENKIIAGELAL